MFIKKIKYSILALFLLTNIVIFAYEQDGIASWYGPYFHGKKTANGEIFNTYSMTAAHKSLPFGSIVRVISLENGKEVIVRINDRGPFAKDRIIDLSKAAASELDLLSKGTMNVKIILLEKGQNVYHKYENQNYNIQIASFKNENSALELLNNMKEKGFPVVIQKFESSEIYFRIIIEKINYTELQLYRIKLQKEGYNYLIVKNKS
jgi:rare lipoprotein A